jgi:hypothetical protein
MHEKKKEKNRGGYHGERVKWSEIEREERGEINRGGNDNSYCRGKEIRDLSNSVPAAPRS